VIFSSSIIKPPEFSIDGAKEKREREKKKKGPLIVSSNKGEVNILRGETTSTSKIFFDVIPFSLPPSYHFKNH
jgi:hypothetical protein